MEQLVFAFELTARETEQIAEQIRLQNKKSEKKSSDDYIPATSTEKRGFFSRFRQRVDEFNSCFEKGIEKDTDKAIVILKQEAAKGLPYAQNNLGGCYYNGRGVERNYDEAFKLFKSAAAKGEVNAQYNLGNCYAEGHGTKLDYSEAVKWYKKAADQSDVDAQYDYWSLI